MDTSVNPGDDFYLYANGRWLSTATEEDVGSAPFAQTAQLAALNSYIMVLRDVAATPTPGSVHDLLKKVYLSVANESAIEDRGLRSIQELLDTTRSLQDHIALARVMSNPLYSSLFALDIAPLLADPSSHTSTIAQGSLGLPTRDHYVSNADSMVAIRRAYVAYIQRTLERVGFGDAAAQAQAVLQLETQIAHLHLPLGRMRDRSDVRVLSLDQLMLQAPGSPWRAYAGSLGGACTATFQVMGLDSIRGLAALFVNTEVATWRTWMTFRLLDDSADYLPVAWRESATQFRDVLHGQDTYRSRNWMAFVIVTTMLDAYISRRYVNEYFDSSQRERVREYIRFCREALRRRLQNVPWFDSETRSAALEKLAAVREEVGHPDVWPEDVVDASYDELDVLGNLKKYVVKLNAVSLQRCGRTGPRVTRATVSYVFNAFYSPTENTIIFPAAFLSSPFYDATYDPAVIFGTLGMVIGHELGHGFDDQCSKFDAQGATRNWWSDQSRSRFDALCRKLVHQYDQFSPLPGLYVNGSNTLGENLADLIGVIVAHDAYLDYTASTGGDVKALADGFTGSQRFFLGTAQNWRLVQTPAVVREQIAGGVHSPARYRVYGSVRNVPAWYAAFNIKSSDPMFLPESERVLILGEGPIEPPPSPAPTAPKGSLLGLWITLAVFGVIVGAIVGVLVVKKSRRVRGDRTQPMLYRNSFVVDKQYVQMA